MTDAPARPIRIFVKPATPPLPSAQPAAKAIRRTQAERSETMRTRLAEAAYATIAQGGVQALRLRAVAQAAGVSQGALLHHYADKNSLVLAAIEYALTLARNDSAFWLDQPSNEPAALLRSLLGELRGFFFSDRFWVAIGITMEASKDAGLAPTIRAAVSALRTPVYQAWVDRLVQAGWRAGDAARMVRSGSALMAGGAIRRFWAEPDALGLDVEEEWIKNSLALL